MSRGIGIEGTNVNAKASSATRRVWRMTAENPLGEVLELVPKLAADRYGKPQQGGAWEKVQVGSPTGPLDVPRPTPTNAEYPRPVVSRTSSAAVPNWRASSWDLLQGCSVSDLSEKMPMRIFNNLFSVSTAASPPSRRKQS